MRATPGELVHRRKSSAGGRFFDDDVSGKRGVVGHDHVVANETIVRNVGVRHEQAVTAELCESAAAGSATMDGDALANMIVVTDLEPRLLALEFQVLRLHSDRDEGKDLVIAAD